MLCIIELESSCVSGGLQPLPPLLLPFLRLAHAADAEELARPGLLDPSPGNRVVSAANEQAVLHQLLQYFEARLRQCVAAPPTCAASNVCSSLCMSACN